MSNKVPSAKVQGSVAKATVNHQSIRVAASDPALAGKLKVHLGDDTEGPILWYIKFNIVLDPQTVSGKSMTVMETGGYIIESEITYDTEKNHIVIKPVDPYEEETFYVLNITRKVRSKGGHNLKREIHILFKIKNNRIEEYKMLAPNVEVAKPRKKPEKLKAETAARVYGFTPKQQAKLDKAPAATLPFDNPKINVVLLILGVPTALAGLWIDVLPAIYAGAALLAAGMLHLAIQFANKRKRAAFQYNIGALFFNAGFYKAANKRFRKASALDTNNEMAEFALRRSAFYTK